MKKFYKQVSITEIDNEYILSLDGKAVKTPLGNNIFTDNKEIALRLQKEWEKQEKIINSETMPITQIITTCIDRVGKERQNMHNLLLAYLDTDLLCYRAPQPPEMKKRQEQCWDIWLKWFEDKYGYKLETTYGLSALKQPEAAKNIIDIEIRKFSDLKFTIIQLVTSLSGSIILALAFMDKKITPKEIFDAAHIEEQLKSEIYNEDFYGKSPTQKKSEETKIRDLEALEFLLKLL